MSKKRGEPSQVGKWTFVLWKLWLWATVVLMKDVTLRIGRSRRSWIGLTAILSQVLQIPRVCGIVQIWVKDFANMQGPGF